MQRTLQRLAGLKLALRSKRTQTGRMVSFLLFSGLATQGFAQASVSVNVTPKTIAPGGSATISWSASNVSSCTYEGSSWPSSGSQQVSPPSTKTYTLVCVPKTGGGQVSGSATLTVTTPSPPTVSVSASPTTINAGQSSTITWSSSNASSCTYDGLSWPVSGSQSVSPTATKTYTLSCSNAGGTTSRSVTITVKSASSTPPLPTVTASLASTSIPINGTTTVTWSSTNATSCNQGGTSGTKTVGPYSSAGNRSLIVSCTGAGGTTSKTLNFTVTQNGGSAGQCPATYANAPSTMQGMANGSYYYKVTGASGHGWGTDYYTDDSNLAAMAVHAGIVPVGGSAIIRVDKSGGRSSYTGSTRNGITTSSYGSWSGTYTVALHQACGAVDTTPDAFSFVNATNQAPNTLVTSDPVTLKGFSGTLTASVTGDSSAQISKDGTTWAKQVSVSAGNSIRVRLQSAASAGTTRTATVSVNGVSASWSVTTAASSGGSSSGSGGSSTSNWLRVSAATDLATLQNGSISIRQRDKLKLTVTTDVPASCTAKTLTGGTDKNISFSTEGNGVGLAVNLPKFYFLGAQQSLTVSCSASGKGTQSSSFTVKVSEIGSGTGPVPTIFTAAITTLSGSNLNGKSFSLDTPVRVSWTASNATACYIKDRPQEYAVINTGTELPPYYFGKPGNYNFEFYCVGNGGMSTTKNFSFTVTAPSTAPNATPGFRGEYEVNVIQVNGDGKPDLHVKPAANNTRSGVSEFVLVSQPKNNGYTISRVQPGWNTSAVLQAGLEFLIGDVDVDGHADMIIKNINGVDDVIIYAPSVAKGIPGGLGENGYVVVDRNFKTFFEDLYNITLDPTYLDRYTYRHTQPVVYHMPIGGVGDCMGSQVTVGPFDLAVCADPLGLVPTLPVFDNIITLYKVVELSNGMPDYTYWLPETNNLRCVLWCNGQLGIFDLGKIVGGSVQARKLTESLSAILRRPFMRNVLLANYAVAPIDGSYPGGLEQGRKNKFEIFLIAMFGMVLGQDYGCRVLEKVSGDDMDCEFFASIDSSGGMPAGDLSITPQEREYAASGDRVKFWESRHAKGDPVAHIALHVVKNTFDPKEPAVSSLGMETNDRLQSYLDEIYEAGGPRITLEQVGVAVMQAHVDAVDDDIERRVGEKPGALSVPQVNTYHVKVFENLGIPASAYGGEAYFGMVPTFLYCPKCDPVHLPQR